MLCALRIWPAGAAAAGCCFKVLLLECCVRFGAGLLVPLQGAAAGCCCRVLLLEWCVRFGAGLLVCRCCQSRARALELAGAAVRVACALWSWHVVGAAGCRWRVLLSEFCVRFGAGVLVPMEDACKVRLQGVVVCALWTAGAAVAGCRCFVPLQNASSQCCCQSELACWCRCSCKVRVQGTVKGLSASLELGCCYRVLLSECSVRYEAWVLVSLQGVAARCLWQCGCWA